MSSNEEQEEGKTLLSMELDPENAPREFTAIAELAGAIEMPPPLTYEELQSLFTGLPYPFTHEIKFHLDEDKELLDVVTPTQKIRFRTAVPRFRLHEWLNCKFPMAFGWINRFLPRWPFFRRVEYYMAVDPAVEPEIELIPEEGERVVRFRFRAKALQEGEEDE